MSKLTDDKVNKQVISPEHLEKLLESLGSIKYGSVTLIIQDGKVIQIDKNEKVRLK